MIFGILDLSTFTTLHVIISLVALVSGAVVLIGAAASKPLAGWTALFLLTTALTSITGFFFPFDHLLPSHILGILSLLVLVPAIVARYPNRMRGRWRWIYLVSAAVAFWFNAFVAVVQAFQKMAVLAPLAPTQSEPPFLIAQVAVLAVVVILTVVGTIRFHPARIA